MRKTFIILCIWSIIVGCSRETKEDDTSSKEKEGWKLVWHDEFNRDDIFATGIWSKIWGCPTSKADWCKTMNHDPSLFEIKDGNLILFGKPRTDPTKRTPKSTATAPINPDDYNIYAVELDTDEVRFYVNGKQTFSYARVPEKESEGQFPFNRPYMLRIDMQLGGSWVGEVKPFTKPIRMYVDWVRFYQKINK